MCYSLKDLFSFGLFLQLTPVSKNLKTSHNTCKKFLTITKLHIKLLSEIFDTCQKFLKGLVFNFFETVAIF